MKIILFFLLSLTALIPAKAQKINLEGENSLVLDNSYFKSRKVNFTRATGDWFITPTDGVARVAISTREGDRNIELDIGWDGRGQENHINYENNNFNANNFYSFAFMVDDPNINSGSLSATPERHKEASGAPDDDVTVQVLKMDGEHLSFRVSATLHYSNSQATDGQYSSALKISGVFNLQRPPVHPIVNNSYHDCDSVLHDKLIGPEVRSPTECEEKYDQDVRRVLQQSLQPVVTGLTADQWIVDEETGVEPTVFVERGSEKNIFETVYHLRMHLSPESPIAKEQYQHLEELGQKMQAGNGDMTGPFKEFREYTH